MHICELGNQRITKGALTVLTSHGYRPELRDLLSILQSLAISPSPAIASAKKAMGELWGTHGGSHGHGTSQIGRGFYSYHGLAIRCH